MFNKLHKKSRRDAVVVATAALVLLGLAAGPAAAVPQIMSTFGDQIAWTGAEINAMGGTGVAVYRGGMSNIFNPALLSDATGYRLDGGVMLDQEHEDRFQPLFDSFDSWVTDAAIASNRHHYWQTGFAAAGRIQAFDFPLALGLSLADRYPFSYTFDEELLNPSPFPPGSGEPARDQLIEERQRDVSGTLRTLSLGAGADVTDRISVGAAVHYAYGTRTEVNSVRDYITTDGDDSYRSEDAYDLSGMNVSVGVRGRISERVEVGLAWESALEVDGDRTATLTDAAGTVTIVEDGSVEYPQMFRAGLVFRPRTDPRTVFTVEAEYKPWSEVKDSSLPDQDNPYGFEDVTDVRVGLEHTFYNGMPLRFGFRYLDAYADREGNASVFSAGVGAPLGGGMVSASLELTKMSTVEEHQFPYPTNYFGDNFNADPTARVDDTRFRIGVGYRVEF